MALDILFVVPLIIFGLLGFRDGLVRKLVAIGLAIGGMFLAQFYMRDIGQLLKEQLAVSDSAAPLLGYLTVFFAVVLLQSLGYRLLAKGYKIGGIADRTLGVVFGLAEGALIISVILVTLSLRGWPDRKSTKESRTYGALVSFAPQITDFAANVVPEAKESIEKITEPIVPSDEPKKEEAGEQDQSENEKYAREFEASMKKQNQSVDSLLKKAR